MAYDPTLLPLTGQQPMQGMSPGRVTSGEQAGFGMPNVTSPMGGVANMVKALTDGNNQFQQRQKPPLLNGMSGQVPGAPMSLAPPQDPTSPTNPAAMGGSLGSQMMTANGPAPGSPVPVPPQMSGGMGGPTPMPMPRPPMPGSSVSNPPQMNSMPFNPNVPQPPMNSMPLNPNTPQPPMMPMGGQQPADGSSVPNPPMMGGGGYHTAFAPQPSMDPITQALMSSTVGPGGQFGG